ncbi:spermidine/putrescine ABC transporter substrate-binding protein [Leucobacter weissii]|uniref:Spermidine/putrescine ABC transporter substrate-binding protein n=1 Tax=Leucobacter weissii TaxID=1983706 RepID=A0A939MLA8_9MICO|nr:spermidine/putrescine ABC transporter substrate-binding protein [Leucobacter weissii]
MSAGDAVAGRVNAAVDAWLRWLPTWQPGTHRGRARMCRRCTGSPVLAAAGIEADVPHQVAHALTSRMQRIIDRAVEDYIERELPVLHAELTGEQLWNHGGFEPGAGLDPEYDGLDLDPEAEDGQPFLFTMVELAEQSRPEPPLPRPPLRPEEKRQLLSEIELSDHFADDAGRRICFALAEHRPRIRAAVQRFVEPQIQALLDELTRGLEPPR